MKRHLIQSLVILLLLTISCDTNEILKKEIKGNISRIDPKDEPQLLEKLNSIFGTDDSNKRTASSRNEIDLTAAIKVIDVKGNKASYTFGFKDKQSIKFKNFILAESRGFLNGYTLNYLPDKDWVKKSKFSLTDFSGTVVGLDLNGDTISYAVVVKGKAFAKNTLPKTNGRVQAGLPLIPDNSGCYELVYSTATGCYFWLDVVCGQGGGSGGNPTGSGGNPSSGGYDPNSPYSGGSNDPTTGGNGNQTGGGGSSSTSTGGTIGVSSPVFLTEEEIEALTDPEQKRIAQLTYLENHGASEFVSMVRDLISTSGITIGEVWDINEMVNKVYINQKFEFFKAIFNPETVGTILSLGFYSPTLSTPLRNTYFSLVARYAATNAGKGFASFQAFKNAYGAAGEGKAWHHLVQQTEANVQRFGAESVHNTNNLIRIEHGAATWHQRITNYYNKIHDFTGNRRFYEWVADKSFQEQYEWALRVMEITKTP